MLDLGVQPSFVNDGRGFAASKGCRPTGSYTFQLRKARRSSSRASGEIESSFSLPSAAIVTPICWRWDWHPAHEERCSSNRARSSGESAPSRYSVTSSTNSWHVSARPSIAMSTLGLQGAGTLIRVHLL